MKNRPESGEKIKILLYENGIKQKDFAVQINMSQKHLSNIINGRKTLTQQNASIIADRLGVSAAWLLGYSRYRTEEEEERAVKAALVTEWDRTDVYERILELLNYTIDYPDEEMLILRCNGEIVAECTLDEFHSLGLDITDFAEAWIWRLAKRKGDEHAE